MSALVPYDTPTACSQMPTLFDDAVATSPAQQKMLRRICFRCPVQADCYLVATTTPVKELSGFMAGLTEAQRHHIQKPPRRRKAA